MRRTALIGVALIVVGLGAAAVCWDRQGAAVGAQTMRRAAADRAGEPVEQLVELGRVTASDPAIWQFGTVLFLAVAAFGVALAVIEWDDGRSA